MDSIYSSKPQANQLDWNLLLPLLAFAGAIRVILSVKYPSVITADELIQYREQAYRIVTGHGVIPWEYHVGSRTWVLPALLVPLVYLVRLFSTAPAALSIAIAVLSSLISLLIIPAGYRIANDISGKQAARITAWILAIWSESVFFSSHFMADTLVAVPLIWSIALARKSSESFASAARFGALLGLAAMLRMQLAPALAIIALVSLDFQAFRKQLLGIIAGALPVLILFGVIDWITWGWPFYSYWMNLYANSMGVADYFGKSPFWYYLREARMNWSIMTPFVLITAIAGAIRAPKLAAYAIILIVAFSAIAHKEDRFIYPALPILLTLCGIGSAQFLKLVPPTWQSGRLAAAPILALAFVWGAGSTWSMTRYGMTRAIHRNSHLLTAVNLINADPRACGVVMLDDTWAAGRSGFRNDIKIFNRIGTNANPDALPSSGPIDLSYNRIIAMRPELNYMKGSGFQQLAKFDLADGSKPVFIYARDTPCRWGEEQFLDQTWIDPKLAKLLQKLNIEYRQ